MKDDEPLEALMGVVRRSAEVMGPGAVAALVAHPRATIAALAAAAEAIGTAPDDPTESPRSAGHVERQMVGQSGHTFAVIEPVVGAYAQALDPVIQGFAQVAYRVEVERADPFHAEPALMLPWGSAEPLLLASTRAALSVDPDEVHFVHPQDHARAVGGAPLQLVDEADAAARLDARTRPDDASPARPEETELLSSDEIARRIGVGSRQTVHNWLRQGRLIGWKDARRGHRFPEEQIDRRGRPLGGLDAIAQRFPDGHAAWGWIAAPNPALGGARPLDLLREGRADEVIAAAEGEAQGDFA